MTLRAKPPRRRSQRAADSTPVRRPPSLPYPGGVAKEPRPIPELLRRVKNEDTLRKVAARAAGFVVEESRISDPVLGSSLAEIHYGMRLPEVEARLDSHIAELRAGLDGDLISRQLTRLQVAGRPRRSTYLRG